ncbi:protein KRI1 homolog [Panonychus citri]|uniref:protein KRI1 homolog n=1 Tax=Panonychus citri TaxID=50023 RepID=UPI002308047C|nr:protein KRI1 homolog [Panonychus citri]
MPKLLLDSDDEDASGSLGGSNKSKLTINESYATAYERWRRKEEYQRLKDKYGEDILSEDSVASGDDDDDDDDDDSESDDSSDVDETIFDQQFLSVYGALKARDPHIYDEKVRFFEEDENSGSNEDDDDGKSSKKVKSSKGMNLLEYHVNLVKTQKGMTEEDRAMETGTSGIDPKNGPDKASYVQEMESIKKEFKNILQDDEDGDDLIKGVKKVPVRERKPDPSEVLRGASKSDKRIGFLANYWDKKDLDDREKFLKDYILEKKYLDPADRDDGITSSRLSSQVQPSTNEDEDEDEDESDDDDDEEKKNANAIPISSKLSQMTEKSATYHFQETDPEVIKRYPREVESVRNLTGSTIRNAKRSETKERKAKEKQEALQRFRDLRRQEVKAKLAKLKEISGNDRLLTDKEIDIDTIVDDITNFDPEKYDQCMSKLFDVQFYDVSTNPNEIAISKPKFDFIPGIDDVDDNLNPIDQGEGTKEDEDDELVDIYDDGYGDEVEVEVEEEEEEEDDDDGPSTSKGKRKKKEKKKVTKEPAEKKNIGIYEDLIAGEVPTRFRYRQVPANDFGLSPEELLFADDKDLNRWVTLKKTSQHRTMEEEKYDIKVYGRKGKDFSLKKKILKSIYDPEAAKEEDEDGAGGEGEGEGEDKDGDEQQQQQSNRNSVNSGASFSSRKRRRQEERDLQRMNLTEDRLRSYDLPVKAIRSLKGRLHRQRNERRNRRR